MRHLTLIEREKTETFTYQIGGIAAASAGLEIEITFVNEVFSFVKHPFSGAYDRDMWKVLSEINEAIEEIENKYRERNESKKV